MTIAPLHTGPHPANHQPQPRLRRVRYEPDPGVEPAPPRRAARAVVDPAVFVPGPREHTEAHHEVLSILRVALEVLDRRRSTDQLAGLFTQAPLRYWRVAVMRRRPRSPAQPGRMVLCMPRPRVAEVALPVHADGRVRALAARFEHGSTGWRCTAVRLG